MYEETIRIDPPIYIASTMIGCWRCDADMPVVAIIASKVPEIEDSVCIFSDIKELPTSIITFIQKRFPTFKLKYSKTLRTKYYANTCPKCGVISGDFYLHSEPGAPFFPTEEDEAESLTIEEVPIEGSIKVRAGFGVGVGELILEHAKRI